jgi:hypothetical protein
VSKPTAGDPQARPLGPADWTPQHYRGNGLQPFDVIDAFGLDFYEGNALKYLLRWRKKNGIEDLVKARTYIQQLIDREQHAQSLTKEQPR